MKSFMYIGLMALSAVNAANEIRSDNVVANTESVFDASSAGEIFVNIDNKAVCEGGDANLPAGAPCRLLMDNGDTITDVTSEPGNLGEDAGQLFDAQVGSPDVCWKPHDCSVNDPRIVSLEMKTNTDSINSVVLTQGPDQILAPSPNPRPYLPTGEVVVEYSVDGSSWTAVTSPTLGGFGVGSPFAPLANEEITIVFDEVTANFWRLVMFPWVPNTGDPVADANALQLYVDTFDAQWGTTGGPATLSLCEWGLFGPPGGFVEDDPIIRGFNGQSFYFMGTVDDVYNLVSSEHLQINTRIITHPGMYKVNSWMGEIGVVAYGHSISFNNLSQALCDGSACPEHAYHNLDDMVEVKYSAKNGSLDITVDNRIKIGLRVHAGEWTQNFAHIDLSFMGDTSSLGVMHGILGQTAYKPQNSSVSADSVQGEGIIDGVFTDYKAADGNIFGTDFKYNRFAYTGEAADQIGGVARRLLTKASRSVVAGAIGKFAL